MKIEINKNKLIKALGKADKVVSKSSSLPVLSCVVLDVKKEGVFVKATNLEIGLKIKLQAKIEKEGEVAVPSGTFVSYISNLGQDEELTLEQKENLLHIYSPSGETKINTLSPEDFPTIPDTDGAKSSKLPVTELTEGFKSVWYAASVSSMKPELSSVYVFEEAGSLVFVATDSFRLAEKKIKTNVENFESVLIPQRNVLEITRIIEDYGGEVQITFEDDRVSFSIKDEVYLVTRVIDGNFPDYKQIIPKESTTEVNVLKDDLQNTLKISNIFSNNFNQVNFRIGLEGGTFEILSKNDEKGESRNIVPATVRGDDLEINFNQKYINDCFVSVGSESIVLNFNGAGKPMLIKGVNDDTFQYLVMPLNK